MSDHERDNIPKLVSYSACQKNLDTGVVSNAQTTGCGLGAKKAPRFPLSAGLRTWWHSELPTSL